MTSRSRADEFLLEQIRTGQADAWGQLVERYQGRLVAFARSRTRNDADAEDLVQDTFLAFLRTIEDFRHQASIETYLFTILRRKIIDAYRGRKMNACLIQDGSSGPGADGDDPLGRIPAPDMTASWYVRRDEQAQIQSDALAGALREIVDTIRDGLKFRDLKILELLLYSQLRNKEVARIVDVGEKQVALIKHRFLKAVRERVARADQSGYASPAADAMLSEVWESLRLSCPKRSTIGAFLLDTLDEDWREYVDFHLNQLGCRFCRANLDDLKRQTASPGQSVLRNRILESTVGFLRRD